jgi:hypothetical protein
MTDLPKPERLASGKGFGVCVTDTFSNSFATGTERMGFRLMTLADRI